jgi:resolvase-like protein
MVLFDGKARPSEAAGPCLRPKVDVIVVYKVDRLTCALAEFAKLVELVEAHGVSFISVTYAFNTTTSMGRLTLNMLFSRWRALWNGAGPSLQSNANARSSSRAASLKSFKGSMP